MLNRIIMSEWFGFVMTVAKFYDDEHSIEEIAQKLRVPVCAVDEAVKYISMARENYRMNFLEQG